MLKPTRFMAPEGDPSPSGGGVPAPAPAPAANPAPTPSPASAPTFTPDVLASLAQQLSAAIAPQVRDSVMAEARRAGLLGKKPDDPPANTAPPPSPAAPQDIATLVQQQVDQRLAIERGLDAYGASDAAKARARAAMVAEKPQDPAAWISAYATDMGWSQRTAPAAGSNPNPTPGSPPGNATPSPSAIMANPSPTPGGPPPPPPTGVYETPVFKWSEADSRAFVEKNGHAALLRKWANAVAPLAFPMMRR